MKIANSNISFQSQHAMSEVNLKQEKLQLWVGNNPNSEANDSPAATLDISEMGKDLQQFLKSNETKSLQNDVEDPLSETNDPKLMLLEKMMEHLLGKKFKFKLPKKPEIRENMSSNQITQVNQGGGTGRAGWGLIYDSKTIHYESEKMSFKSTGTVKTADGREITVDLELNMSREFMSSEELHLRAGDAVKKDPLVINFNAPAAMLTDTKFSFDIDNDGSSDQISRLRDGSGFLSLDLNNDGRINDGSELFGPQSGNGFADLAMYDQDNNGWIDENDAVFDKLRIWTKDEYGNDTLFALGEKGIGAICLGSSITPFSLRGENNTENGIIQKTGIFLNENGTAGTIQHIDLAV